MKEWSPTLKFFCVTVTLLLSSNFTLSLSTGIDDFSLNNETDSAFLPPSITNDVSNGKFLPVEDRIKFAKESEIELLVSPEREPPRNRDIYVNNLEGNMRLNLRRKREITRPSLRSRDQKRALVTELSSLADHIIDSFSEFAIGLQELDIPSLYGNMSTEEIVQAYIEVMKHVARKSSIALVRTAISSEQFSDVDLSSDCQMALVQFVFDMRDFKLWPFKMLDATPFMGTGNVMGNTGRLGSYDQCLDILEEIQGKRMYGKDCLLGFSPHPSLKPLTDSQNLTIFHGTDLEEIKFAPLLFSKPIPNSFLYLREICVPSLCSSQDISKILKLVSDKFQIFETTVINCESKEDQEWTPLQIYLGAVYGGLMAIVLLGTFADYFSRRKESYVLKETEIETEKLEVPWTKCSPLEALRCFSLLKTMRKLWPLTSDSPNLPGINGIKAISIAIVVHSHTYALFSMATVNDFVGKFMPEFRSRITLNGVMNNGVVVESFFLISGMLVSRTFSKLRKKIRLWHLIHIFVFRYFRLMPSVLGAVGLIFLLPVVTGGPLAQYVRVMFLGENTCKERWWTNVVLTNNFYSEVEMCLPPSWYTSVDLQLFALFLVPVYVFAKWPKKGGIVIAFLTSCSLGFAYYMLERRYSDKLEKKDYYRDMSSMISFILPLHTQAYLHVAAYAIGIALERLIFFKADVKLNKCVQAILWILSIGIISSILWATYSWREYYATLEPPPKYEWVMYYLFRTIGWPLAHSWVIYALLTRRARILEMFLENRMMNVLGRMSLSMFLVHVLVIASQISQLRGNQTLSHYYGHTTFVVTYVLSVVVSIIFYAVIESPFCELQNLLFRTVFKNPKQENKSCEKVQNHQNGSIQIHPQTNV